MEQVVRVAKVLREEHDFRGYIHLKTIPDASEELLAEAGRYADRLSINIELPTEQSLSDLAPEKKDARAIRRSMGRLRWRIDESRESRANPAARKPLRFAPGGQSTQMIVGADATNDQAILATSANLYGNYRLRRVYYSAFSPIPDASKALPLKAPPLVREHRLYQADWLMRFYGFSADEIVDPKAGMLDLDMDPKLAWALRHRERFPVDLNKAPREMLLRVPGLGSKAVERILSTRRVRALRSDDLGRLHVPLKKNPALYNAAGPQPRRNAGRRQPGRAIAYTAGPARSVWLSAMRIVTLAHETDFAGWRAAARQMAIDGVAPEHVAWCIGSNGGLFADDPLQHEIIDPPQFFGVAHVYAAMPTRGAACRCRSLCVFFVPLAVAPAPATAIAGYCRRPRRGARAWHGQGRAARYAQDESLCPLSPDRYRGGRALYGVV